MANSKDAFEERLERLGQSGTSPKPVRPAPSVSPSPKPHRRAAKTEGTPVGLLVLAVSVLLLGAGAFGVMLMAPQLVFGDPDAFVSDAEEEKSSAVITNVTATSASIAAGND